MAESVNMSLRILPVTQEGFDFIDIRYWYQPRAGEWQPGAKGVTILASEVDEVCQMLQDLKRGYPG